MTKKTAENVQSRACADECSIHCKCHVTIASFQNAFPVSGMVTSVHLLSLDALLAVIDSIEAHCHHRILHTASKMAADQAKHKSGESLLT